VAAHERFEGVQMAVGDGLNEQAVREVVALQMWPVLVPVDGEL
jgi:hypothetical protein